MKKILFGFLFSITAASFVSCDMNNPNEDKFGADPESGWVNFETPGGEATLVAGCDAGIPIILGAPVNENGLEVNYTITDVVGSTAGIQTRAFVPAGSREGSFMVTGAEGLTSPVEFVVTLTSTSRQNVSIGFPGSPAQTMTVKLLPAGIAGLYASYDVVETSFEGEYEYESNITQGAAANEIIITNLYGVNAASQTRATVNADGTLSFPAFADNFLYTTGGGIMRYFEGLSGTADPCTGKVKISFNLRHGAGGATVNGPYTVTLTRQ